MFENLDNSQGENKVPDPPAPEQPERKEWTPIVDPPPTSESPHMDLPLTPKTPHTSSKIKVIMASLAGVILLGGIGYGAWWAYTDYLEGDIGNISKIFGAGETQPQEQEVMVENEGENMMEVEEAMVEEKEETMMESKRYTFDEIYISDEERYSNEHRLNGYIELSEDNKTFDMSLNFIDILGEDKIQEDLSAEFGWNLVLGPLVPISLVRGLNKDIISISQEMTIENQGDSILNEKDGDLYFEMIDQYKDSFPKFGEAFTEIVSSGVTLANLDFSHEIQYKNSTYPTYRFRFNDNDDTFTMAVYDITGKSKNTNLEFKVFFETEDISEFYTESMQEPGSSTSTEPIISDNVDTDEDGLSDLEEQELGTNINEMDSDSDGLNDYDEVNGWGTDPLNWDSDGDGYGDYDEISNGYDPLGEGRYFE